MKSVFILCLLFGLSIAYQTQWIHVKMNPSTPVYFPNNTDVDQCWAVPIPTTNGPWYIEEFRPDDGLGDNVDWFIVWGVPTENTFFDNNPHVEQCYHVPTGETRLEYVYGWEGGNKKLKFKSNEGYSLQDLKFLVLETPVSYKHVSPIYDNVGVSIKITNEPKQVNLGAFIMGIETGLLSEIRGIAPRQARTTLNIYNPYPADYFDLVYQNPDAFWFFGTWNLERAYEMVNDDEIKLAYGLQGTNHRGVEVLSYIWRDGTTPGYTNVSHFVEHINATDEFGNVIVYEEQPEVPIGDPELLLYTDLREENEWEDLSVTIHEGDSLSLTCVYETIDEEDEVGGDFRPALGEKCNAFFYYKKAPQIRSTIVLVNFIRNFLALGDDAEHTNLDIIGAHQHH